MDARTAAANESSHPHAVLPPVNEAFASHHFAVTSNDIFRLSGESTMSIPTIYRSIVRTAALLLLLTAPGISMAADNTKSQYYELRIYSTRSEDQQKRIVEHWQNAAVPAYNRLGVQQIGVFTEQENSATNRIYVLIPYDSLETFAAVPKRLAADSEFQKAAEGYLSVTRPNAAYVRVESSLLVAFDGMKRMEVEPASSNKRPNVFELRTYMSPSEGKGDNKVKMFNDGEIAVMKEVGLAPIFFGQMISGSPMPSLVYMTSAVNMEEHREHWQKFGNAPGWVKLRDDPQYKDNMTGMIRVLLKRTAASQI